MRAISLARFVGLTIWAGVTIWAMGPAPALALPSAAPTMAGGSGASPPFLVPAQFPFPLTGWPFTQPAGHHGHHGHWGHRHGSWSRDASPYGPAPALNAAEAPLPGYAPAPGYATAPRYAPATGSTQPPAMAPGPAQSALNRGGEAQAQTMPGRGGEAAAAAAPAGPSIQWVNPDRVAR